MVIIISRAQLRRYTGIGTFWPLDRYCSAPTPLQK